MHLVSRPGKRCLTTTAGRRVTPKELSMDDTPASAPTDDDIDEPAAAESLIEEVSIDGMCGVY
jgi:mycofactocin precursor